MRQLRALTMTYKYNGHEEYVGICYYAMHKAHLT